MLSAQWPTGEWRSTLKPAHLVGSLAAWTAQYCLPMWLGSDADTAAAFVERSLYQAAVTVTLQAEAVGTEALGVVAEAVAL